jgi:hypothetical protein
MNGARVTGVVLLGLGAVLIILGVTASRSLSDSLSNAFLGHLTRSTMWYIYGGVASAVVGLLLAIGALGRGRT